MSETVKRYPKRLTRTQIELAQPRTELVLAADYDALAAELATVKKVAYGNLELMEDRDAALAECERLRASLNDAAKAMHWVQANTPMSKRISASLAKARLAAELSALSAKP